MAKLADISSVTAHLARTNVAEDEDLDYSGKGLKLDTEKDAQEIINEINKCKKLGGLKLEGNTLGVQAAKGIAKALESHPEFKRALWKDMFTGRLKSEIPEALTYLSSGLMLAKAKLTELDLSDNALGPIGVEGIRVLLKSPCCFQLQVLKLNNNGLGIGGGKMLAEGLLDCYKLSSSEGAPLALRVFVSGRNRLENDGAKALAEFFSMVQTLEEIAMPQNGIYFEGIAALSEAFARNKNLRVLNLNDNTFVEEGAEAISMAIASLKHLEVLNFGDCLIRTKGAKAISAAIANGHENLKELHLGFNEIDIEGAMTIAESLKNKSQLEKVDLDGNKFGEDGCSLLQDALRNQNQSQILGSLSEDEGADDDDDDDDEDDDEDDDDEEDEQDVEEDKGAAEEHHPSPFKCRPPVITRVENNFVQAVTSADFLQSPSSSKLKALGNDRSALILQEIGDNASLEKILEVFFKVASCTTSADEETKLCVFNCADTVMSRAFLLAEKNNLLPLLSNSILVHLGMIKSEDKKFQPVQDVNGALVVLEHVVRQHYFSRFTKEILQLFLSRPNKAVEACGQVKHRLMQSLYRF